MMNGPYRPPLLAIAGELSIDLLAINGGQNARIGSLKEIGVKSDYRTLQESSHPFDADLTQIGMMDSVRYNRHDLEITKLAAEICQEQIAARLAMTEEFNDLELLNRHDAGMAVAVLAKALFGQKRPDFPQASVWRCQGSQFTKGFQYHRSAALQELLLRIAAWDMTFTKQVDAAGDKSITGEKFSDGVRVNDVMYRIGVGGLHSEDAPGLWSADERYCLLDFDVGSFYPALIVNHRLAPAHLPRSAFLKAFDGLRKRRLAAKAAGQKALADGLKISINSVFGKTKSAYSWLLDPVMSVGVTILGQLSLLTFVDLLSDVDDTEVISANTDGLTIRTRREYAPMVIQAMHAQAAQMNLELDMVEYSKVARRDVNNYISVTADGRTKGKGAYAHDRMNLGKKATNRIVIDAVQHFLVDDIPIEDTVAARTDVRDFLDYFKCTRAYRIVDAAGVDHGSIARWYLGTGANAVHLDKRRIADGQLTQLVASGAVLVPDLPEDMPPDVDRAAYTAQAQKLVDAILNPVVVASWSVPLADLSQAQHATQRRNLTTVIADPQRVDGFDLETAQKLYAEKYRGNAYSSMKALAVRVWCQGCGTLTLGDLLALLRRLDEADGYFSGSRKRTLTSMAEWVATEISPWPLPRNTAEQVARAATWAIEKVEPLKRQKKKLTHRAVLDSSYVSGPALRKFAKGGDEYALACSIAAVSVKHGKVPDLKHMAQIIDDVKQYVKSNTVIQLDADTDTDTDSNTDPAATATTTIANEQGYQSS